MRDGSGAFTTSPPVCYVTVGAIYLYSRFGAALGAVDWYSVWEFVSICEKVGLLRGGDRSDAVVGKVKGGF